MFARAVDMFAVAAQLPATVAADIRSATEPEAEESGRAPSKSPAHVAVANALIFTTKCLLLAGMNQATIGRILARQPYRILTPST
jgi:hypothetical protein